MQANPRFSNLSPSFWANVRTISQAIGYTDRRTSSIRVPTDVEIIGAYAKLGLSSAHLFGWRVNSAGRSTLIPTELGERLLEYFVFRATALSDIAEPNLMDAAAARVEYEKLLATSNPLRKSTQNKQTGEKARPAMLTEIVNMILESKLGDDVNYNPQQLTTVTRDGLPVRTLARRVDGAYPAIVNPIAIWEIKEYYYTTTFGSRVADGVYETMLDGLELQELRTEEGVDVKHYLIVDSHFTWWKMGRSYLCRMVDMIHMGFVDEVLFGREVIGRLPELIDEWVELRAEGAARDLDGANEALEDPETGA
jgi:hypothetical protein